MNILLGGAPLAYWVGFLVAVLLLIACDFLLLNRAGAGPAGAQTQTRGDLLLVLVVIALAASFGLWLGHIEGRQMGLEFASGYLIELSLSIDNLFVFLLMFRSFGLTLFEQKKVLRFGIGGAILMRGIFLFSGIALLRRFAWVQLVFGAILLVAALRLIRQREPTGPGRWSARLCQRALGRDALSRDVLSRERRAGSGRSLLSAIVAIEIVDLIFALDSIPAVLAVTHRPFVAYTSNICAILGLRALYFLLSHLLERLRFLHFGLAAILGFVGAKMLLARWVEVPVGVSLAVIILLVISATAASLLAPAQTA